MQETDDPREPDPALLKGSGREGVRVGREGPEGLPAAPSPPSPPVGDSSESCKVWEMTQIPEGAARGALTQTTAAIHRCLEGLDGPAGAEAVHCPASFIPWL